MLVGKRILAVLLTLHAHSASARLIHATASIQSRDDQKPSEASLQEVESERQIYEAASYLQFEGNDIHSGEEIPDITSRTQSQPIDSTLRNSSSIYYVPPGFQPNANMHYANLSIGGSNTDVKVLGTERFSEDIKKAACTKNSVTIILHDEQLFQKVKIDWNWVNEKVANNIILITESDQCNAPDGDQTSRQPWIINHAEFDDAQNQIVLKGTPKSFQEAFGKDWRLSVKRQGPTSASRRRHARYLRRDHVPQALINLNHNFSGLGVELPEDFQAVLTDSRPIGALECNPCHTYGAIDFDIDLDGSPKGLSGKARIRAHGVGASITTNLYIYHHLLDKTMSDHVIWGYVPPGCGIYIKDILDFGPTIKAILSTSLASRPEKQSVLSLGYNLTVPDPSEFSVDLDTSQGFDAHMQGWTPSIQPLTPGLSANYSLEGRIGPKLSLSLDGNVLGQGISIDFTFSAATLSFNITAQESAKANAKLIPQPLCTTHPDSESDTSLELNLTQEIHALESARFLAWHTSKSQILAHTTYNLLSISTCLPIREISTVHITQEKNHYIPATAGLEAIALNKANLIASAFETNLASHVTQGLKTLTSEVEGEEVVAASKVSLGGSAAVATITKGAESVAHIGAGSVTAAQQVGHGIEEGIEKLSPFR